MKQYDNHFAVAVMICLKEIIFYISSYLNFRVGKYTIFLFSTVGRNIAANVCIYANIRLFYKLTTFLTLLITSIL